MSYKIGSFNMYKFHAFESDDEIRKDLKKISNIIYEEAFDIVALQEIFSEQAMNRLIKELGNNWDGRWESPKSYSSQAAEGYAFIWNKRNIKLAESQSSEGKRTSEPRIYNQYKVDRKNGQKELIRNPYFARFNPINTRIEIRLINTHIMFNGNNGEDKKQSISVQDMRRNELDILVKCIYAKESDKRYGNNMDAYTIILGDYNLNLIRDWTNRPYLDEYIEIDEGRIKKKVITIQDQLTTLKSKIDEDSKEENRGFANNYDHFSYDTIRFSEVYVKGKKVDSVRKYLNDDFKLHRKEISDHVPIVMDFDVRSIKYVEGNNGK